MKPGLFSLILLFLFPCSLLKSQDTLGLFKPAPTFHKERFWILTTTGAVSYTGVVIGLNELWYADFERSGFQFFNDWNEWNDMDKMGHLLTTYAESYWMYKGLRWTGVERKKAIWAGAGLGMLFQSTIEVMDAYSAKWGFSVADMGFNLLGASAFVGQELAWQEQRIIFKFSTHFKSYPHTLAKADAEAPDHTVHQRAKALFGSSYVERSLKDYNAQTIWTSVNIHAFIPNKNNKFPKWLNMAFGYGAENMFGGFENRWEADGHAYYLNKDQFPRYHQFFLSPDIDLSRIKVKSPFLKTLLGALNVIKIPAPTLEFNTQQNFRLHWFYF